MLSMEARLAEALTTLKKVSASKFDKVFDECSALKAMEAKVNCAEAALKGVQESASPLKLENLDEALHDFPTLFGVEPKTTPTNNETAPITKHNGAIENFVEGSPFNGDRSNSATITESDKTTQRKEKLVESLVAEHGMTEEGARIFLGMKPKIPAGLTRLQQAEYITARRFGLNESDALKLAKLPLHKASR